MRVFIVGASGVLGRATATHLAGHTCAGTTRSPQRAIEIGEAGRRAAEMITGDATGVVVVATG
jgi:nucleoside-diphosphate-sugar epimerase